MCYLITSGPGLNQAIKGKNKGNSRPCGRTKNEREQEAKPGPLSLFESTRSNLRHRDQAVPANNVDLFGSPDALPTAGASNLPCAGSPARSRRGDAPFCSRSSHAPHGKARFPVHHNIVPDLGVLWIVMRKFFRPLTLASLCAGGRLSFSARPLFGRF